VLEKIVTTITNIIYISKYYIKKKVKALKKSFHLALFDTHKLSLTALSVLIFLLSHRGKVLCMRVG